MKTIYGFENILIFSVLFLLLLAYRSQDIVELIFGISYLLKIDSNGLSDFNSSAPKILSSVLFRSPDRVLSSVFSAPGKPVCGAD